MKLNYATPVEPCKMVPFIHFCVLYSFWFMVDAYLTKHPMRERERERVGIYMKERVIHPTYKVVKGS